MLETPKKRRSNESNQISPKKKKTLKSPFPSGKKKKLEESKDAFVPKAINKLLLYEDKQSGHLNTSNSDSARSKFKEQPLKSKVLQFVKEFFVIPDDLEENHKYGPKSGSCYEERLLTAYQFLNLKPLDGDEYHKMCYLCGEKGHFSFSCKKV